MHDKFQWGAFVGEIKESYFWRYYNPIFVVKFIPEILCYEIINFHSFFKGTLQTKNGGKVRISAFIISKLLSLYQWSEFKISYHVRYGKLLILLYAWRWVNWDYWGPQSNSTLEYLFTYLSTLPALEILTIEVLSQVLSFLFLILCTKSDVVDINQSFPGSNARNDSKIS